MMATAYITGVLIVLFSILQIHSEPTRPRSKQLLFANRRDIRYIDLTHQISRGKYNSSVLVPDLQDATALDWFDDTVCWSDIQAERVQCVSEGKKPWVVISSNLPAPEDLSIDWLTRKLYWTDSETNRIEVVSLVEPYYRAVLIHEDIDQPRAIVVSVQSGLIFWSDWGEVAKIERAGMDGGGRRVLLSESDLVWPNGLALDEPNQIIYWIDGKLHTVGHMTFEGTGRGTLKQGTSMHPFALVYFDGMLYWSDWNTNSLHSMPSSGSTPQRPLQVRQPLRPMDLVLRTRPTMIPLNPCTNSPCSHLCLLNPSGYLCACPTGIRKLNSTHCADSMEKFLLVARSTEIRLISLDTEDYTDIDLGFKGLRHVLALDYWDGIVYWTDDETRRIESAPLNSPTRRHPLASVEIVHPDGIAIDYNARQIYWTDAGTDRVEVIRLDGNGRKVIVARGLQEPRAIAVDGSGWLFWSDWGKRPKIERSRLDGSGRSAIIVTEIEWPNGIALDTLNRQIYWCDASIDRIETAAYDGSHRRVLISENLPHTFGFSLVGEYLYWTDWQLRIVERAKKTDGSGRRVIKDPFTDPMGIRGVVEGKQLVPNGCSGGGGCEQLCFWVNERRSCACGEGHELSSDSRTCSTPSAYLIFTKSGDLHRMSLTTYAEELIPVSKVKQALAIGVDHIGGFVYWSDAKGKSISRGRVASGWESEKLIDVALLHPEGLAVDYVSRNLYWTDVGFNRIEVATLNGTDRRAILWGLDSPKSIAIDYTNMVLFYSIWGEPAIETCQMDGKDKRMFIKTSGRVNGLLIDEGWVYWANIDAGRVERFKEGKSLEVVAESQSPFSLAVFGNILYFSDLASNRVLATPKIPTPNATTTIATSIEVLDMNIYNKLISPMPNNCNNAPCTHLCFNTHAGYTCGCPTHYTLVNGTFCHDPSEYLLLSTETSIIRLLFDPNHCPDSVLVGNMKKTRKRGIGFQDGGIVLSDTKWGREVVQGESEFSIGDGGLVFWAQGGGVNVSGGRGESGWSGIIWNSPLGEHPPVRHLTSTVSQIFFSIGSSIFRMRYDGMDLNTLNLPGAVQSIAVDELEKLLYFYESGAISVTGLDFSGIKVLAKVEGGEVDRMVLQGSWLYYVQNTTLSRLNRTTGLSRQRLLTFDSILDLISVESAPARSICRCSHICLHDTAQCACPTELQLAADGRTCVYRLPCGVAEFSCKAGSVGCIPNAAKCNGVKECFDGSDEEGCCRGCKELVCATKEDSCPHCLLHTEVCNGVSDCPDGSDELDCPSSTFLGYLAPVTFGLILVIVLVVAFVCKWRMKREKINAIRLRRAMGTADTLLYPTTTGSPPPPPSPLLTHPTPPSSAPTASLLAAPNPSPATDYHYKTSGPPPTPCSTDVCDESEIYAPPPPSPHTSNSTGSMKWSGGWGRSSRMPGPPPPSPVL